MLVEEGILEDEERNLAVEGIVEEDSPEEDSPEDILA